MCPLLIAKAGEAVKAEIEYNLGIMEDEATGQQVVCLVVPEHDLTFPLPDSVLRMITELAIEVKAHNFLDAVNRKGNVQN